MLDVEIPAAASVFVVLSSKGRNGAATARVQDDRNKTARHSLERAYLRANSLYHQSIRDWRGTRKGKERCRQVQHCLALVLPPRETLRLPPDRGSSRRSVTSAYLP